MRVTKEEIIIRKARANHLRGFEGVGGKLILTDASLTFKPHSFNIQTGQQSFPLEDVSTVITAGSDLISKRLRIALKNGSEEDFIVNNRKGWARDIERAVKEKGGSDESIWRVDKKMARSGTDGLAENLTKRAAKAFLVAALVSFLIYIFLK